MSDSIEAAGALATAGLAASALDGQTPGAAGHGACANCGAALAGPFCGQCGQKAHLHRSLAAVGEELLHGLTHFEGKAWATLPMLLFRPGKLTRNYILGQRARYIAPVPLFLLVVFLMFFVFSFLKFDDTIGGAKAQGKPADRAAAVAELDKQIAEARAKGDTAAVAALEVARKPLGKALQAGDADVVMPTDIPSRLSDEVRVAAEKGELKANFGIPFLDDKANAALKNPELVLYKLQTKAYKLSFLLVPLSVPWLWLAFCWRRDVRIYDHAVFALYSISFMSLLLIVMSIVLQLGVTSGLVWMALLLAPSVHMFVQLRGAYGLSNGGAAWRTVYMSLAGLMTLSLFFTILVAAGLLD